MKKKLFFGLLMFLGITFFLFSISDSAQSANANWWDKFGEPKYGGTITVPFFSMGAPQFDNYSFIGAESQYWLEPLWSSVDWTLDRQVWPYQTDFTPEKYCSGNLAESWELPDAQTIVVHIRKGVHWQDKPPVNGREFTAYDVQAHYDRILGTGGGFNKPAPGYMGMTPNWKKVTATDKYTVVIKFTKTSGFGLSSFMDQTAINTIEAPEWVAQGDLQNWKKAVGTGPWMLSDYLEGSSITFTRNPNYWGYDARYPKNRLPYADELKLLIIRDKSTQMAALRTGKIDMMRSVEWQQADTLIKFNPKFQQVNLPFGSTTIGLRNDKAPFTDIRVRKALQLSLDLKTIAKTYFNGLVDGSPCGLISPALKGYCYPYKDWPQGLKDEYVFNPKKAKELLTEAGYPNGFKTNIVAANVMDVTVLQLIKSYFKDIGVDMEIRVMDFGSWRAFVGARKHDQMLSWGSALAQSPIILVPRFYSKNMNLNMNAVSDPEYDKIVEEYNNAPNADAAAGVIAKADKYAIEKHWVVNTFSNPVFNIWQPYLKGYSGESGLQWGAAYLYARMFLDKGSRK